MPKGMVLEVSPLVKKLFCLTKHPPNGFFDFEAPETGYHFGGGGSKVRALKDLNQSRLKKNNKSIARRP